MILTILIAATAAAMIVSPTLSARKAGAGAARVRTCTHLVAMAAAPDARTGLALAAAAAALHAVGAGRWAVLAASRWSCGGRFRRGGGGAALAT